MKYLDEKEVLLRIVIPYFRRLGYTLFRQEQSFGVGARRMRTDLVVYVDDDTPFAIVEVKGELVLDDPSNSYHPVIQQALRYALVAESFLPDILSQQTEKSQIETALRHGKDQHDVSTDYVAENGPKWAKTRANLSVRGDFLPVKQHDLRRFERGESL